MSSRAPASRFEFNDRMHPDRFIGYLAGVIAEQTGSFYVVFRLCAVLSIVAAFLSFFLRPPER